MLVYHEYLHACIFLVFSVFFFLCQTTLARIIANSAKQKQRMRFVQLSATTSGVSDVKETIKVAKNEKKLLKRETLLFIDEIHRFNKLQQVKPARYVFVLCIAQFHMCV